MQHFERVRDVIAYAQAFHRKLSGYYRRLREMNQPERVLMLLDYLQSHEDRLIEALDDFSDEAGKRVLETWFQYTPEKDILGPLKATDPAPDLTVEQVMKTAMKMDTTLIRFLEELTEQADSQPVTEVFQKLVEMETAEDRLLAEQTQGIQEL
ncbi:MAG: hypothetical protein ACOC0H_01915 [Thermodesulfobacteriota bacterium]